MNWKKPSKIKNFKRKNYLIKTHVKKPEIEVDIHFISCVFFGEFINSFEGKYEPYYFLSNHGPVFLNDNYEIAEIEYANWKKLSEIKNFEEKIYLIKTHVKKAKTDVFMYYLRRIVYDKSINCLVGECYSECEYYCSFCNCKPIILNDNCKIAEIK